MVRQRVEHRGKLRPRRVRLAITLLSEIAGLRCDHPVRGNLGELDNAFVDDAAVPVVPGASVNRGLGIGPVKERQSRNQVPLTELRDSFHDA